MISQFILSIYTNLIIVFIWIHA